MQPNKKRSLWIGGIISIAGWLALYFSVPFIREESIMFFIISLFFFTWAVMSVAGGKVCMTELTGYNAVCADIKSKLGLFALSGLIFMFLLFFVGSVSMVDIKVF